MGRTYTELESSRVFSSSHGRQEEQNPDAVTLNFVYQDGEYGEFEANPDEETLESVFFKAHPDAKTLKYDDPEAENLEYGFKQKDSKLAKNSKLKKKKQVFLEGYVEPADEDDLTRTKSLTDEDLDELKGCLDLGFGFSYEEIPELCNTLPALELCYSMSQKYLDEQQKVPESSPTAKDASSPPPGPIASWKISSPGDHPEEVKARLKFWAQTVACTVRLCS